MSNALAEYRRLEIELFEIRRRNQQRESEEEDRHLEKMDEVWKRLSAEDRAQLDTDDQHE